MAHLVTYVKHDAENVSKLAKLIDEKLKRAVWSPAPGGPAKPASTPRQPGFGLLLAAAALGGSALLLRRFVAK